MPTLKIIIASSRPGRVGPAVAGWVEQQAQAHGGFTNVEVVDLAEVNLPFMDEPHHPRLQRYTHEHTRTWSSTVATGDAFVFVMPEYNSGFNAVLKNALDYLHAEWQYKPVGLVSYGGALGGSRAAQMLKPILLALRMIPLHDGVTVQKVQSFIAGDGSFAASGFFISAAKTMFDELVLHIEALRPLRAARSHA